MPTAKPSWRSTGPTGAARRRQGKADTLAAHAAARAVQAGTATGTPKAADGQVEMIRSLHLARRSAVKARTQAANQLNALLVTAPDGLRAQLRGLPLAELVATAARLRPDQVPATPTDAAKFALRSVAGRWLRLTEEITELDVQLGRLVATAAPALVAVKGVGTQTAAVLLVAAGDNPERLRSEGAFAHLCGVAPIPASSGKTTRHRLSRGGNRQANSALYLIAVGRMAWHPPTRAYVKRRTTQGKTKAEIIRCLIGGVSGARSAQESGRARGAGQGTAPLSCHPNNGQFEFCRPWPHEPTTGFRTSPQRGPSIRHRRCGLAPPTSRRRTANRSADRCLLAGTGPAPPTT